AQRLHELGPVPAEDRVTAGRYPRIALRIHGDARSRARHRAPGCAFVRAAVDLVATGRGNVADDPHRAVGADAHVARGLVADHHERAAVVSPEVLGIVDDPRVALRIDGDAFGAAGHLAPRVADPAVDLVPTRYRASADHPHRTVGAHADVTGASIDRLPG